MFYKHHSSLLLNSETEQFGPSVEKYEPRCEKTGLQGLRPGPTQSGLYSHRRWLRGLKFCI